MCFVSVFCDCVFFCFCDCDCVDLSFFSVFILRAVCLTTNDVEVYVNNNCVLLFSAFFVVLFFPPPFLVLHILKCQL